MLQRTKSILRHGVRLSDFTSLKRLTSRCVSSSSVVFNIYSVIDVTIIDHWLLLKTSVLPTPDDVFMLLLGVKATSGNC